jgi:carbon starvation protein
VESIVIAVVAFAGYFLAYHTYGKFLARKIFKLDAQAVTPAHEVNDGKDFVPTKLEVLFGHHYTSIAGTGPIVGPALGVIWGWVPALIWIFFGSIFMGAVHDFGALVISARNRGKSIGDIASTVISRRVQLMFLVIAVLFTLFPESIIPIWVEIPIAMAIGHLIYRKGLGALPLSLVGVFLLYVSIVFSAYLFQAEPGVLPLWAEQTVTFLKKPALGPLEPAAFWMIILLVYAFIASVLPVWRLLQPRDYINGHELFIVLFILTVAIFCSHPPIVAPALQLQPKGAPPLWPFLFITIACGAISGFHSLVASGTSSKQIDKESHALTIGYGGMLMEGVLATLVIIAVAGGIGLAGGAGGLSGVEAWKSHYASWDTAKGLGAKVGVFVNGSANMIAAMGIPRVVGVTVMGVFVASFAATTLDTATRLQRYILTELALAVRVRVLANKWITTAIAVISAGLLAVTYNAEKKTIGAGGGLILWPLFGATNQLLACLALLVLTVYLRKRGSPSLFTLLPMIIMLVITGFAMGYNLVNFYGDGLKSLHLFIISAIIVGLEAWMVVETFILWLRGKAESPPPPAEEAA